MTKLMNNVIKAKNIFILLSHVKQLKCKLHIEISKYIIIEIIINGNNNLNKLLKLSGMITYIAAIIIV